MTYTVHYKKVGTLFWKRIKRVKGDGIIDSSDGFMGVSPGTTIPTFISRTKNTARWFVLDDETRIEVPAHNVIFRFSKERFHLIKESVGKESGGYL